MDQTSDKVRGGIFEQVISIWFQKFLKSQPSIGGMKECFGGRNKIHKPQVGKEPEGTGGMVGWGR